MKAKNQKPVSDPRPRKESAVDLEAESKEWSPDKWEFHLRSLEISLKESQIDSGALAGAVAIEWPSNKCPDDIVSALNSIVSELSEKQQFVIRKIYWDGLSERQVAKAMGISHQGVFDLKHRAIQNLRKRTCEVLAAFPMYGDWAPSTARTESA